MLFVFYEWINPAVGSRAIISNEKLSQTQKSDESSQGEQHGQETSRNASLHSVTGSHKGEYFLSLQLYLIINHNIVLKRKYIFSSFFAGKMVLPFEPKTLTFQNLQYYVDTPMVINCQSLLIWILLKNLH